MLGYLKKSSFLPTPLFPCGTEKKEALSISFTLKCWHLTQYLAEAGARCMLWSGKWMKRWTNRWMDRDSHVRVEINLFFPELALLLASGHIHTGWVFSQVPIGREACGDKGKKRKRYQCSNPKTLVNSAKSSALRKIWRKQTLSYAATGILGWYNFSWRASYIQSLRIYRKSSQMCSDNSV